MEMTGSPVYCSAKPATSCLRKGRPRLRQCSLTPAALMVMMMMANIMERLFERVRPIPVTEFWVWEGSDSGNGYGKVSIGGREGMVHRVVYDMLVGPTPPDRVLSLLCPVGRGCNPDHL